MKVDRLYVGGALRTLIFRTASMGLGLENSKLIYLAKLRVLSHDFWVT